MRVLGVEPVDSESLLGQVLEDPSVAQLLAAMIFVHAKQLHSKQAGKAGAAAPTTSRSGRVKKGQAANSSSSSSQSVKVRVCSHKLLLT